MSEEIILQNTEQLEKVLREQFGLDKPTYIRYSKWMWKVIQGDLGNSLEFVKLVTEV